MPENCRTARIFCGRIQVMYLHSIFSPVSVVPKANPSLHSVSLRKTCQGAFRKST